MARARKKNADVSHGENPGTHVISSDSHDTSSVSSIRERIAARAFELYIARGGQEGHALEDWLAAEQEVATGGSRRSRSGSES